MDIRIMFVCTFASSLSDTHFHTSMMTCLGFFISWVSVFSRDYIDREALYRILLCEGKLESTSSGGGGLGGGVMKVIESLVCLQ